MKSSKTIINEYVKQSDWRVKENSTVQYSLGGLILSNSGNVTSDYWLSEVYDQEIGDAHRNADLHIHDLSMLSGYCFTGDTRVKTLDGKNPTFKELVDSGVKTLKVFSYDLATNKVVIADAINPRITRQADELVRVTLATKQEILCTPDHLFLLRDGSYRQAKDLKSNDSLMALYITKEDGKYIGINKAWNSQHSRMYLHRWVAENYIIGRALTNDEIVHHIDGDKHNNLPENLVVMSSSDHRALELKKTMSTTAWKEANAERLSQYNKSAEKVAAIKEQATKRTRNEDGTFATEFKYQEQADPNKKSFNHRVRKVEHVFLATPIDVYDLTVPGYENFAIGANIFVHNCAGWSLKQLIREGLGGVPGKITSAPASHLSTLCNQMVNFLGIMQNEWAGAQAFSSFDTYLAPFVRVDKLSYKEVKQCIQSFIYGVNTPSRWGTQAPFTNITLDWVVPADLAELPCIVGGKDMDFCYKDCKKEMDMVNKAFIEIMIEGDANGRGFQYPIPTYSITRNFDWSETENNKLLFEMTAKYGTPYFSNYINSDMEPSDVRSMCVLPNTMVWAKIDGRTKHITIEELYNTTSDDIKILSKYGYRDVKELQRFEYKGDMLQFTTESGKSLTTTPDHELVVYKMPDTAWFSNGELKKRLPRDYSEDGWTKLPPAFTLGLEKKQAKNVIVGDYFTCRHENPGEKRKGMTYEEAYGETKAAELKKQFSEDRKGKVAWNKGVPISLETKYKISNGLKGHYVSENCRRKSSERWQAQDNPKAKGHFHSGRIDCSISTFEFDFKEELNALGLSYIHQYVIETPERAYVPDFYIPDSNLLIELETTYNNTECSYNEFSKVVNDNKRSRYEFLHSLGYNVLVFNPELDNDSYRSYINCADKILDISTFTYDGYVYDLEVDCDDIEGDTTMYHTFYANEILTGNCCRLRLDLRELRKKSGGFFGSGESTGSIGVVTINMPRIGYLAENETDFYKRLDHMMDIAARSLDIKRKAVTKWLEDGLYPYTKRYLGTFSNHFSTIATVGGNEMCLNAKWIREDLTHEKAQQFMKDVLNHMRNRLSDYQEMYGDLFNLEAAPAESTSYRLAKHDKERYPDIIVATSMNCGAPYYTNSSHLPVGYTEDVFSALDIQDELQTLYTSGTVFHAFLGEKLPDWRSAANLVRKIAENYKLPYYTMSPTYSVCSEHGYISGEACTCPKCGKTTEVYSRITGYYRPVQNWNDGKLQEFKERKVYRPVETCCVAELRSSEEVAPSVETFEPAIEKKVTEFTITLVGTKTCPNCKIAASLLDKFGYPFTKIYVEDDRDFVAERNISSVPALVINSGDDERVITGVGTVLSAIKSGNFIV